MADQRRSKPLKCDRHPYEHGAGVCASCLKERLLDLLAAQNRLSPVELRPFPRSVSPSASRRRPPYGFFSTPQVGPVPGCDGGTRRRFSLFSFLFGRRGSGSESGPGVDKDSESGSWIWKLVRARRRKSSKLYTGPMRRTSRQRRARIDRGMSPAAADESDCGSESRCTSASSGTRRMPTPSPMRRTAVRHCGAGQRVSSFAICLSSPMVRPSPGRRVNLSEIGISGDIRVGVGGGGSLEHNRSRKLVDFGRIR